MVKIIKKEYSKLSKDYHIVRCFTPNGCIISTFEARCMIGRFEIVNGTGKPTNIIMYDDITELVNYFTRSN